MKIAKYNEKKNYINNKLLFNIFCIALVKFL